MHCLIEAARAFSTSSVRWKSLIPVRYPHPVLEMSPKFRFLNSSSPIAFDRDPSSVFAEVLRCHSYVDEIVYNNTIKILEAANISTRADGIRLAKMRYIAMVYHAISDRTKRKTLKSLAEKIEKCKASTFLDAQEIFYSSLQNADIVPQFEKCIHKNDLALCHFRQAIELKNWEKIKNLLTFYPKIIPLYEHIDCFLEVGKHQKIVAPNGVLDVFMEYAKNISPYFIELDDFETVFQKVIKSSFAYASEATFDKNSFTRSYISDQSVNSLKKRIDELVKISKEGFVKTKEYEQVQLKVAQWKKKRNIKDGQNVAVVDALNFGMGHDPKSWKSISDQFDHVFFATRSPPNNISEEVLRRYEGNAFFCNKLSTDDLIILRMALEFGSSTSVVTNDRYRDHRRLVCNGDATLANIWDDFMIDAVYRHFDGRIENRRNFNLRVRKVGDQWFVPVMQSESEGNFHEFRKLKVYCIENQRINSA